MSCSLRHALHLELGLKKLGLTFSILGVQIGLKLLINARTLMLKI